MGAFSTHQSNMAAKIVALVVVALALANAAPRDMSKLDNQVLEDKINEILSSSELMQSAQAEESPDWMVAARRTNSTSYTMTQTASFSGSSSAFTGTLKSNTEKGYATQIGIYSNGAYASGCSLSTSTSRRSSYTVTFSSTVTAALISNAQAQGTAISGNVQLLIDAIQQAGSTVVITSASGVTTVTVSTSGAAQLTFGFAALLAALFAHLF